jgi:hypothetical protein
LGKDIGDATGKCSGLPDRAAAGSGRRCPGPSSRDRSPEEKSTHMNAHHVDHLPPCIVEFAWELKTQKQSSISGSTEIPE